MSEYTPDTEAVRDAYASFWERRYGPAVWYERCQDEFDRWLAQHDAEVRAAEQERIAGLIDACWQGDKVDEWEYQNTLPDWRMGMSDAARIVREAQS